MDWKNQYAGIGYNLGADPEIFVRGANGLIPAYKFLPDKTQPKVFEVPGKCGRGKVNLFWDGFQAEFSSPATGCIAYVVDGIRTGLQQVRKEAQVFNPTAKLSASSVEKIPVATLRTAEDHHVVLGCDPSFNAYHMGGEQVMNGRKLRYRFAGGHIHFGLNKISFHNFLKISEAEAEKYVKALDMVLGVWSVGAAASFDNPIRRRYYGLAGEYRLPAHGLEYRTLSNFWYMHPGLANFVLMFCRGIIAFSKADLEQHWLAHPQETISIINGNDVPAARKLLKQNEHILAEIIGKAVFGDVYSQSVQTAVRMGQQGIESVISDPTDYVKNWKFDEEANWRGHAHGEGEGWCHLSQTLLASAA